MKTLPKFNFYGDSYMKQLLPALRAKLGTEFDLDVTLSYTATHRLLKKLRKVLKMKSMNGKYVNNIAVVMVGAYDVMRYKKKYQSFTNYFGRLKKNFTNLVLFLKTHHKRILTFTVIPALKRQKSHFYWKMLRMFNEYIMDLKTKEGIEVHDLYSDFLKQTKPPQCFPELYELAATSKLPKLQHDVLLNHVGVQKALDLILPSGKSVFRRANIAWSDNIQKSIKELDSV